MHHMAEIEAWRLHRGELARQVETDRTSRRLRASRPRIGFLARLEGRLGRGISGGESRAAV